MNYNARKAGSIVLGLASAVGTVLTAILVGKETRKASKKLDELEARKDMKKIDRFKELAKIYWPAGLACLGTVASTTISLVVSVKTEASLIAATTLLNQGWLKYKWKVKELLGVDAEKKISDEVSKDEFMAKKPPVDPSSEEHLYFEEHLGFFKCKPANLLVALSDMNQRLHAIDYEGEKTFYWTTLGILMKDAKATVLDKSRLETCQNIGWDLDYLCEVFDLQCAWVHSYFTHVANRDTGEIMYTRLGFYEEPVFVVESDRQRSAKEKDYRDLEHEAESDMTDYDAYQLYCHSSEDVPAVTEQRDEDAVLDLYALYQNRPEVHEYDPSKEEYRKFISGDVNNAPVEYSAGNEVPK